MVGMNISTAIQSTGMLNSVRRIQKCQWKGWTYRPRNPKKSQTGNSLIFCKSFSQLAWWTSFLSEFSNFFPPFKRHALTQNGSSKSYIRNHSFFSSKILGKLQPMAVQPPLVLVGCGCLAFAAELPAAFRQLHQLDSGEGLDPSRLPSNHVSCFNQQWAFCVLLKTGVRNTLKWYDMIWCDVI